MSEWSQNFTLTKNVSRGFILCSTPPTQWTDRPIRWRCLLRILCSVRRPLTALDCVLLKDRNLSLSPRQGPEINSRACLWVSPRPRNCWRLKKECDQRYKVKLRIYDGFIPKMLGHVCSVSCLLLLTQHTGYRIYSKPYKLITRQLCCPW